MLAFSWRHRQKLPLCKNVTVDGEKHISQSDFLQQQRPIKAPLSSLSVRSDVCRGRPTDRCLIVDTCGSGTDTFV